MLSSVLWVAFSRIILGLTPLITLPAMTRAFAPEWYGVWTQIAITSSFIVPLVGMGFDMGVVRFFSVGFSSRERVRDFYSMAVLIWLVSAALTGVVYIAERQASFLMFSDPSLTDYALIAFVWIMTQVLYNFTISYFRVANKMRTYALIDMSNGLISALIMVLVPLLWHNVFVMLLGLIMNQALFVTINLSAVYRNIGFQGFSTKNLGIYLKYGLPLVPNSLFLWLVNSSGRYFLTHLKGLTDVGLYSAGSTVANVMTLFFMPISFVLFPVIARLWEEKKPEEVARKITQANRWYLALAIPGACGLSFLAKPLMAILSSKEFAGGAEVILFLTIANLFYGIYQINFYGVLLLQKNLRLTGLFAVAGGFNIVLNLLMVPQFGLRGAALAMLCSFVFLALTVFTWARKELGFHFDWQGLVKILISALAMTGVLYLWRQIVPEESIAVLLISVLIGIMVYALFVIVTGIVSRQELKELTKKA